MHEGSAEGHLSTFKKSVKMKQQKKHKAPDGASQMSKPSSTDLMPVGDDFIRSHIYTVRGVQIMLDSDLAKIYHVETRVLNQSVKRNENRFPSDFRFRLSMEEYRSLMSQIVISNDARGETRDGRQKLHLYLRNRIIDRAEHF